MLSPLLLLLLVPGPADPIRIQRGAHFEYRGNFVANQVQPADSEKTFRMSLLIAETSGDGSKVYWTLDEQRHGGFSWLDRFGRVQVGRVWQDRDEAKPALLYVRQQGTSIVPIPVPLLRHQRELSAGVKWIEGRLEYQVEQAVRLGERDTWRIAVGNAYGRKRTLWVDQRRPLILATEENVFIGQGEKHRLRFALVSQESLPTEQVDEAVATFDALIQLRKQLGISPRTKEVNWGESRLRQLQQQLPPLLKPTAMQPLNTVLQTAAREIRRQQDRTGALTSLKNRLVGETAPQLKLNDLEGAAFDWGQLKNKVTVLHFWGYRDAPLEEPYGQVAYLDFLHRGRKADQVQVMGIAVDDRLSDPARQSQVVRSVKRLQSFMNLSYPVLLDAGPALRQYGDPRIAGAKLPLFVVIDPAGKIVHYHIGTYEIQRDRGLEELDRVVSQALGSRE